MKEIIPDIDKLFRDAMDQHTAKPSDKVWDHIESNLDKKSVIQLSKRYDQLKRVAVVLALLFGTAMAYLLLKPTSPSGIASQNKVIKNVTRPNTASTGDTKSKEFFPSVKDERVLMPSNNTNRKSINIESNNLSSTSSIIEKKSIVSKTVKNSELNTSSPISVLPKDAPANDLVLKTDKENALKNQAPFKQGNSNELKEMLSYNTASEPFHFSDAILNTSTLLNDSRNLPRELVDVVAGVPINLNPKKHKQPLSNKFSIAANYSPDFGFNTLRDDKPHGAIMDRRHIKDNESHAFSYSTGLSVGFDINKHFSIQTGLGYSQSTIDNHPKNIVAEKDNNGDVKYRYDASCGYGYILPKSAPPPHIGDTLSGVSSTNKLQYIQVPLSLKYSIQKGKIGLHTLAGLSFNSLKSGQLNTTINNGSIKETQTISSVEGLKKHSITGLLGAGIEYHLNNRLSLNFTPTLRLALSSINSGAVVKSYPTTVGLSSGFRIRL